MKLALIFLFAFVVTSRQQIQHRVGHVWLSPYFPLQPILNNYASYPNYYNSYLENKDRFFPLLEPSSPNIHSIQEESNQGLTGNPHKMENAEFPDSQVRIKDLKQHSFLNQQQDPRFFFGNAATLTNPFLRTATFTLTSSINLTSVLSCIVNGDFLDAAAQGTNCRRKREILDQQGTPDNVQFSINPSETLKLIPTAEPLFLLTRDDRQISTDYYIVHPYGLASSKDETTPTDKIVESKPTGPNLRGRRFLFNYYVASTTVTIYTFASTTVTKTVDLGIDNGLNCLPAGFVVC